MKIQHDKEAQYESLRYKKFIALRVLVWKSAVKTPSGNQLSYQVVKHFPIIPVDFDNSCANVHWLAAIKFIFKNLKFTKKKQK